MARVRILNVGHGACVEFISDTDQVWLFDCGHEGWTRPSALVPGNVIDRLIVANYDEDHISDLPSLRRTHQIRALTRNPSITGSQLRLKKLQGGPISSAMESLLDMIETYRLPLPESVAGPWSGVELQTFYNPFSLFDDTNNCSVVSFLSVHGLHMVIPGDLERAGWEWLLLNPQFRLALSRVNVFVASHHGRESGYCREVFQRPDGSRLCQPELVVMSDSPKVHATQEMTSTYAWWATGVNLNGARRSVLTTRCDGTIVFAAGPRAVTVQLERAPLAANAS